MYISLFIYLFTYIHIYINQKIEYENYTKQTTHLIATWDRSLKEETNYDYVSTATKILNDKCKEISMKSKAPPISKTPVIFPKKKDIRR